MKKEWRSHPDLAGRFHPEEPDDLQVVVHDGGPVVTSRRPEAVWVRVSGAEPDGCFTGTVLNVPEQLDSVSEGMTIAFVPTGTEHLIMVTDAYRAERGAWSVQPCSECGCRELFDPPSVLIAATFSESMEGGGVVEAFTARCGLCGGTQVVASREAAAGETRRAEPGAEGPRPKPWWQFWR